MKTFVICIALVVAIAINSQGTSAASCGSGNVHDFYFGNRQSGDRLVFMDNPHVKSKFMRVQSEDVVYPMTGSMPQGNINYIEILDNRSDGTGGCAYIENGGVGNSFVKIHIKSQRNHGYDFTVRIYAH